MSFKMDAMYMSFRKYTKTINKELNKNLAQYDLSAQHGNYLIALGQKDGLSIRELNERVDNDGALTTRVIKKLTDQNLITLTYQGARNCTVFLTQQGKVLTKNLVKVLGGITKTVLASLSPKEKVHFKELAENI